MTYYGGKATIRKWVISKMPAHTCYVEPFAGGLGVIWGKPRAPIEVINDKDERLVNIYRVVQDDEKNRELLSRMVLTLYSRGEYRRAGSTMEADLVDDVEKAWASLVLIAQSINCRFGSGWRTSGPEGGTIQPLSWAAQTEKIAQGMARLRLVEIECRDALEVIAQRDSASTLFYCDPPYPGTNQGHYSGYTLEDFEKLFDLCSTIEGSAMISCYSGTVDEERARARGWSVERQSRYSCANTFSEAAGADTSSRYRVEELWIRSKAPVQAGLFSGFHQGGEAVPLVTP